MTKQEAEPKPDADLAATRWLEFAMGYQGRTPPRSRPDPREEQDERTKGAGHV